MALRDLLFTKKKPERPPSDEPVSPVFFLGGQSVRFLSNDAVIIADAAQRKSPQLFRITNYIASAVQSVPWHCEADPDVIKAERAGEIPIKAINNLLKSPNDTLNSQQLEYWIALNLMLYARAHFKVGVSSTGTPNGIYPLAAKYVRGVLNNKGVVESYEYGTGANMERLPTRRTAEKRGRLEAYAAEISFPSLSGIVEYNKAPAAMESIATPIAVINALMQRALDTANGHPNVRYIISSDKTLTTKQQDALREYLQDAAPGEDASGEVLLLSNTEVKVHKLDNELGDIHSKIPLDDMTRQIACVFGVPIPLLGLGSADAAKFTGNYAESRLSFWQDTILPCYLGPIASGMTAAICPPGARIAFDIDNIPALWEGRAKLGESLTKIGFLTTNEKREMLDYEPTTEIPATGIAPPAPGGQDPEPDKPEPKPEPKLLELYPGGRS